uniref:Nefa_Nip30_N domain-containing protein n=1 Tax=Rhabditophanes sp. KR3021 TaxID=114890 RepID=A0AC35U1R1_9BILA
MSTKFVSEKDGSESVVTEPVDNRPLYERLREIREKAQAEKEEANKLGKSHVTNEDSEFLDELNEKQKLEDMQKKKDEKDLLKKMKLYEATSESTSVMITLKSDDEEEKPKEKVVVKKVSKQAALLRSVIKRKAAPSNETSPKKGCPEGNPSSEKQT